MADLSMFDDEQFDVILNPVSTLFVPELTPVWSECHRTLIPGGVLITGFLNPDEFAFDADALDQRGEFIMRHPLPYIEHDTLSPAEAAARRAAGEMFHFSHTMQAQLGGILAPASSSPASSRTADSNPKETPSAVTCPAVLLSAPSADSPKSPQIRPPEAPGALAESTVVLAPEYMTSAARHPVGQRAESVPPR